MSNNKKYKKAFVAGGFDHFHVGHQFLLYQASSLASKLVIVIGRDATIEKLKKRKPIHAEEERMQRIKQENIPNAVVRLGRSDGDFLKTLGEEGPDLLLLGYDQYFNEKLCKENFPDIKIKRADPYFPEIFKGSKF